MELLTVFILCHNRPDFARQAIRSAIHQTCQAFRLVISDNSSNDDVEQMVRSDFPGVHYIRRSPMLQPLEHFNCCIEEALSEYFCLFHDDDMMESGFVEEMQRCMATYPMAIACGCNSRIETFGVLESRTSFCSFRNQEVITRPRDLARRYFSRAQSGIAPFPGYIYNRRLVGDLRLPVRGGKYADVTWLLNLVRQGPIVWINKPLMTYRIHENSDGKVESMRDRLRFLGYIKQYKAELGEGLLSDYRSFIYKKILKSHVESHTKRHRLFSAFMKNYRLRHYCRFDYYKAQAIRLVVKWSAK